MSQNNLTPVYKAVTATISDLYGGPPTGEEHIVSVRVCNKSAVVQTYTLWVGLSDNSAGAESVFEHEILPKTSKDIETALPLVNGHKLRDAAGVPGVLVSRVTGTKKSTA